MNDPHVVALTYSIEHGSSVDYSNASPIGHEEEGFKIRVEDKQVRFELKEHYATVKAAREAVEPYIRSWELDASLGRQPGNFKLTFDRPEIIDRNPTPGIVSIGFYARAGTPSVSMSATVTRSYPQPPTGITLESEDPDVQTMYARYEGYCQRRELLASMAYFCLTMLETRLCRGRQSAANKYEIDKNVLNRVGDLTANKGGKMAARKAAGVTDDLTSQESRFLEEAVKSIIRRVAEVAHDPQKHYLKVRLSDLPLP